MKRIGILGGTFNPVHIGHLAIAQMALDKVHLDKVIFVPCYLPPHKNVKHMACAQNRYQMVRLAIQDNPLFEISDFEIKQHRKSYTIDTLRYFQGISERKTKLYFIVGGDTLPQLRKWRYIDDILKIAKFIVVNRPGQYRKPKKIVHVSVTMPGIDISSSYVRRRVKEKKTIKYFLPEEVIEYIRKHRLYAK